MRAGPGRYFAERPRQASRVIGTLLADPQWRSRLANGADGQPLIGALGHSAGGYTVLALAGGKPVRSRLRTHCEVEAELAPVLCKLSRATGGASVQSGTGADGQAASGPLPIKRMSPAILVSATNKVFSAP